VEVVLLVLATFWLLVKDAKMLSDYSTLIGILLVVMFLVIGVGFFSFTTANNNNK